MVYYTNYIELHEWDAYMNCMITGIGRITRIELIALITRME